MEVSDGNRHLQKSKEVSEVVVLHPLVVKFVSGKIITTFLFGHSSLCI